MDTTQTPDGAGPSELVLVRHAESLGNVADREARLLGRGRLSLDTRDADVALSPQGLRQAEAVGRHLRDLPEGQGPTAVLSSPYRRAHDTAVRSVRAAGLDVPVLVDERLRERDLGAFDGLTGAGIREAYPEESERRAKVGKFYYRPPSGESWCDVALRVRSVVGDIERQFPGERLWVFSHQAVIMSFRLVLEALSEAELLEADASAPLPNCSLTHYARRDGGLVLTRYADASAVEDRGADATQEPEALDRSSRAGA